jgi:hypothetical protein
MSDSYTVRDAWSSRDGWHDQEAQRRWWMLSLERRESGPAQEQMRANRLGTSVAELRAHRAARLAQLAADAQAGGFLPACVGGDDPAAIDLTLRLPALASDHRADWEVCAMCVRTLHKTKHRRVEVRPGGVFCCACCAGRPQSVPPEVLDQWLLDRREYKRAAIICTYRVDPVGLVAAEISAEVARFYTDVEAAPLAVVTSTAIPAAHLVPVSTYFGLARERGRGVF